MLTKTQKHVLLDVAREAVRARVSRRWPPAWPPADEFPAVSGVFVTIKNAGELRGCLGVLEPRRRLLEEVARCAADAATADPRFDPVSAAELPAITIEVSVLGPLEPIDASNPSAIVIGRHGLVSEQGSRRGLLLPQVAAERGWTVSEFLGHTCVKAGLGADAWQHGAHISRFDAEVFGD
jgi:AmmeMemoRadiSam system protein A